MACQVKDAIASHDLLMQHASAFSACKRYIEVVSVAGPKMQCLTLVMLCLPCAAGGAILIAAVVARVNKDC